MKRSRRQRNVYFPLSRCRWSSPECNETSPDKNGNPAHTLNDFSWLISLIRRLRPDLCTAFPPEKADKLDFMTWLLSSGTKEYGALMENTAFLRLLGHPIPGVGLTPLQGLIYLSRPDVQREYPLPDHTASVIDWFYRHGVQEHHLWPFLSPEELMRCPQESIEASVSRHTAVPGTTGKKTQHPFGVNLIGYVHGQLGIGEDVRMVGRALKAAGVPFVMLNFPPGKDIPQNDFSMVEHVAEKGPYAFNIFCMTAMETARYFAEQGQEQFQGRYNIGYWPWELSRWPEEWKDLTRLVDEVWVSSRHTYDSLSLFSSVPVLIMPLPVELGPISPKPRQDFGLPEQSYLFCFSFDLNSSIYRKNPQGCVKAFRQAFPLAGRAGERAVGLVIKTHAPACRNREWIDLKRLAREDPRIHIVESTLSRPDLLALYKCCDCFLSLHRAEGFGRGIAEALLLGLHVITTGYSGNVDFCSPPQADLCRYRLVRIKKGQYPFGEGQFWAEPDLDHVAELMRGVARTAGNSGLISPPGCFSLVTTGKRYENRLKRLLQLLSQPAA